MFTSRAFGGSSSTKLSGKLLNRKGEEPPLTCCSKPICENVMINYGYGSEMNLPFGCHGFVVDADSD